MIMFYFLSLDKPEFTQFAEDVSWYTSIQDYFYMAWYLTMNFRDPSNQEFNKLVTFLRENCKRNEWDLTEWLKIQSKKADAIFAATAKERKEAEEECPECGNKI